MFFFVFQESSMSFFVTLQSNFQHVMQYENPELQLKARSIIPHHQLSSSAQHKLKELKEADPGEITPQQPHPPHSVTPVLLPTLLTSQTRESEESHFAVFMCRM